MRSNEEIRFPIATFVIFLIVTIITFNFPTYHETGEYNLDTAFLSIFSHFNLIHYISNMIGFLIYSSFVEYQLGREKYIRYFLTILGINVIATAFFYSYIFDKGTPVVGFSGMAYAFMTLAIILFPNWAREQFKTKGFLRKLLIFPIAIIMLSGISDIVFNILAYLEYINVIITDSGGNDIRLGVEIHLLNSIYAISVYALDRIQKLVKV